jgi:hypothetical protein
MGQFVTFCEGEATVKYQSNGYCTVVAVLFAKERKGYPHKITIKNIVKDYEAHDIARQLLSSMLGVKYVRVEKDKYGSDRYFVW